MTKEFVRVWDLPTRVFHWSLVVAVVGMFATAWAPGVPIEWHARTGYVVLALLLFRLAWGFVGGHWSRFATFVPRPSDLRDYLGGRPRTHHLVGHSPLGALSVVAMLALLAVQIGTGLVGDDEIAFTGPLNKWVSTSTGLAATSWHKGWGKWLLIALLCLHVAAVLWYLLARKRDLIRPMIHGYKPAAEPAAQAADSAGTRVLALIVLAVSAGCVFLLVR